MCWHVCNNCNDLVYKRHGRDGEKNPHPCIWFIPGVDESGLKGCPYMVDETDEIVNPACWIAVPFSKIQELMKKYPSYSENADSNLDEEEQEYNKDMIKRLIG